MFVINYERAKEVFGELIKALREKRPPFHSMTLPQDAKHFPAQLIKGSLTHQRVLFGSCNYMRGGQNSSTAMQMFAPLLECSPEIFDVGYASNPNVTEEVVREVLLSASLSYKVHEIPRFWIANFAKLDRAWGGEPAKLFAGTEDFDELVRRMKRRKHEHEQFGFFGFQEKMVAMLAYFFMDAGIIPEFPIPTPIDFHNGRVLIGHRIIERTEGNGNEDFFKEAFRRAAREVTLWYVREHDARSCELADALWTLSRTFCKH